MLHFIGDLLINLCICTNLSLDNKTGGIDRILNLAKNVSLQEVNVFLVSRSKFKFPFSILRDNSKYYYFKNGIMEERSYPLYYRILFPTIIRLSQEILDKAIQILTFSLSSDVGLPYATDPYLFVKLFYVCKKEKVSVLQFEFPTTSLSSFFIKNFLSIPIVYDAHNVETERIKSMNNTSGFYLTVEKLIEQFSCRISDLVFVVSERDKAQLLSWGVPEQRVVTIPNSIEINKFSCSQKNIRVQYHLENKVLLLFHGPLDYPPNREAAEILTNSLMPFIVKSHPEAYLFLVGRNPPRITHPNILITGFVENLSDFINAADIMIVPLLKGGGTRIKILEYMAAGKAIVSTEKGAEGLDLQNGKDIMITKYPDADFVKIVVQLIDDSVLRENIGANARTKVVTQYDWRKTAKIAVQNYLTLLEKHRLKGEEDDGMMF